MAFETASNDHDPLGIVGTVIAEKYEVIALAGEGGFSLVSCVSIKPVNKRDTVQLLLTQCLGGFGIHDHQRDWSDKILFSGIARLVIGDSLGFGSGDGEG